MMPLSLMRSMAGRAGVRAGTAGGPIAIIDIGSNSIRLVIYEGVNRIPSILFNEKLMAGLGKGLAKTGALDPQAVDRAVPALQRFKRLAEDMGASSLRTVATAAVRDASNGGAFLDRLAAIGLPVELLAGTEEAAMAGHGVLAGIPQADGIVGDLGGGSLELAPVAHGMVSPGVSIPFGVLRVAAIAVGVTRDLERAVRQALESAGWHGEGRGKPFYMVGGSWRALARLHMAVSGYPLPIVHQYGLDPAEPQRLARMLGETDPKRFKGMAGISAARVGALPQAAQLLVVLVRLIGPSRLVVSAYGLREGLLHRSLPDDVRGQDPLICATREEGVRQGRFPEHGDLLDRWIAPVFGSADPAQVRLRHAACLLADVGWRAHPEFRAERGLDTALHGNWVGIDGEERAMLGQALFTHFGGDGVPGIVTRLIGPERIDMARHWGLAMRLGQRLSGGVAGPLGTSGLAQVGGRLVLRLAGSDAALYGEAVERRHRALAEALRLIPEVEIA